MAGSGVSFNNLEAAQAAIQIADIQFACLMCGVAHRTDRQAWKACHTRLGQMLEKDGPVYPFPRLREQLDDISVFPWRLIVCPDLFNEWQACISILETYAKACRFSFPEKAEGSLQQPAPWLPWLTLTYPAFCRELQAKRDEAIQQAADDAEHSKDNVEFVLTRLQALREAVDGNAPYDAARLVFDRVTTHETATVVDCGSNKQRTRHFRSSGVRVSSTIADGQACRAIIPEGIIVARVARDLPFIPPSYGRQYSRMATGCSMVAYPMSYRYSTLEHIAVVRKGLYLAIKEASYAYLYPKSYPIRRQLYHAVLVRDFVAPEYMGALKSCTSAKSYMSAKKRAVALEELQSHTLLDGWPPFSTTEESRKGEADELIL